MLAESGNGEIIFNAVEVDARAVVPPPAAIQAALGYGAGLIPGYFAAMVEEALAEAAARCRIAAGFAVLAVEAESPPADAAAAETASDTGTAGGTAAEGTIRKGPTTEGKAALDGRIRIGDRLFRPGRIIAARLRQAERAAVFVCTIGAAYSDYIAGLMRRGDTVQAFIADAVASAAAEAAAEAVHNRVAALAEPHGWGVSERFSPGYCGWLVAEQHELFALLPKNACGITLAESGMMSPEKSISGVFGLGRGLRKHPYHCAGCDNQHCPSRRILNRADRRKAGTETKQG